MKRRITLSITLGLSIVLTLLMSSDSTVNAQNQMRYVADTSMITLGPDQTLRLTAASTGGNHTVAFRRIQYEQSACNGAVCKHTVSSQTTSPPIALEPNETATFDIPSSTSGVRGVVISNSRNVKVTGIVFDTSTWRVVDTFVLEIQG